MDEEETVAKHTQTEEQTEANNLPEVKNYHDYSNDFSGSNFNKNVSFNSINQDKSFIDLSDIHAPTVSSWHGYKPKLTHLTQTLINDHVLFLGGELDQLDQLARAIAWQVKSDLSKKEPPDNNKPLKIFEWDGLDKGKGVISQIEKECKSGIVILPLLKPENIHFNYSRLLDLSNHSRKVIITTPLSTESWQQQLNTIRISIETPNYQQLFTTNHRSNFIASTFSRLKKNNEINNDNLDSDISSTNSTFINLCESLGSFDTIRDFIEHIAKVSLAQRMEFNDAHLLAEELKNNLNRLTAWYNDLAPKDQLLCLFVSIFNSITIEQLLELAERVVTHIWRPMHGSLAVFDYCDLKSLEKYFTLQCFDQGTEKLEAVNFKVPTEILNHAWHNQRRYLIALLPFCVDIAKESVKKSAKFNYILYGSKNYRESLRQDIFHYLFWIGSNRIIQTIETPLLQILSINAYDARKIVAKTLAEIHITSGNDTVIRLLNKWNSTAVVKEKLELLVPQLKSDGRHKARECLQATVILTIEEIFRQSTTENLSTDLLNLFKKILSSSSSKKVQDYIEEHFLPTFYLLHFSKANHFTESFITKSPISNASISYAMSLGEYYSSNDLKEYFEAQISESRKSKDRDKNSKTNRVKFLSVALGVLRHIKYTENRVLTVHEAFELVSEVLDKEHHTAIRDSALKTLISLSREYSEVVDEKFQYVIKSLTNQERETIAGHLYSFYVEERQAQEDGEENLTIGEEIFPVWIDTERPQMPIEITLSKWLEGAKTIPSTRLAYKADSLIQSRFDNLEQSAIDAFKEARKANDKKLLQKNNAATTYLDKSNKRLSWYSRFISIPIGARRYPEVQEAIIGILPEALKQNREMQDQMIERRAKIDNKKELSLALKAVLRWERRKSALGLGLLIILVSTPLILSIQ